jgi:hypothetical protein
MAIVAARCPLDHRVYGMEVETRTYSECTETVINGILKKAGGVHKIFEAMNTVLETYG